MAGTDGGAETGAPASLTIAPAPPTALAPAAPPAAPAPPLRKAKTKEGKGKVGKTCSMNRLKCILLSCFFNFGSFIYLNSLDVLDCI